MRDPHSISYDGALGQQIIEMHVWAVREGLRGAAAAELFDGFCRRLVTAGVPLWRGFAGMRTLHPQWAGYTYTWRRDLNAIQPVQFERSDEYEQEVLNSPFTYLTRQAKTSTAEGDPWLHLRRRLAGSEAELDFPLLERLGAAAPDRICAIAPDPESSKMTQMVRTRFSILPLLFCYPRHHRTIAVRYRYFLGSPARRINNPSPLEARVPAAPNDYGDDTLITLLMGCLAQNLWSP
jgi:hypothetical protein